MQYLIINEIAKQYTCERTRLPCFCSFVDRKNFMSLLKLITVAAALVSLGGCATGYKSAATYRAFGLAGGYVETEAPGNLQRVEFGGNGLTPVDLLEKYGLYRWSEFSLSKGKPYFMLYRSLTDAALERPTLRPVISKVQAKPNATAYLLLLDKPQSGSFDARKVMQELKDVIEIAKIAPN